MTPYYSADGITLYHADFREVLPTLGLTFDCVVTDPPYGQTSLKWDKRIKNWSGFVLPHMSPTASLWSFGSFKMFWETRDEWEGLRYAQEIIWQKQNGSGFQNDRFKRVHEMAVQFVRKGAKWRDVYKAPIYTADGTKKTVRREARPNHLGYIDKGVYVSEDGGPRMLTSVIYAKNCHGFATNETQKPADIVHPLVKYSCPPTGLLLDPYAGSGTVLEVARSLGIRAVGIEWREDQCEDIARRLSQGVLLVG